MIRSIAPNMKNLFDINSGYKNNGNNPKTKQIQPIIIIIEPVFI